MAHAVMQRQGNRAAQAQPERITEAMRVDGIVQGVGFRPTVHQLAGRHGLDGDVCNGPDGVHIRVAGSEEAVEAFAAALRTEAPPLARIERFERERVEAELPTGFHIRESRAGKPRTQITPDAATCSECLAEVRDPDDRRYRYPFTNCTHCGPRLTIIRGIPYDRLKTSMAPFVMCQACETEYRNPEDRRFHAQPNACPACGPALWLEAVGEGDNPIRGDAALAAAARLIRAGHIVAVKGLGGFHLACDARSEAAVSELRRRKHRDDKPFALMAHDVTEVARCCHVGEFERALLESREAPIVLLERRNGRTVAQAVAPGQCTLGFMLPYTPLHHLLMDELDGPIVLTSGNRSEEPQCTGNDEARERLAGIADAYLMHDRGIANRVDDSVVRVMDGDKRLVRRARGYAPAPLLLPDAFRAAPPVLGMGAEVKNTFCLLREGRAVLSQHIGDLENFTAVRGFEAMLALYRELFDFRPEVLALDLHPEYRATKIGRDWAEREGLRVEVVQHHHAHVAACLAEHGVALDAEPVLGIALDGLGYGPDGTLWGGEFLLSDYRRFKRLASLEPVPMPGGDQAVREPWRMTCAWLAHHFDWAELAGRHAGLSYFREMRDRPAGVLQRMIERGVNAPRTSACGRLFDAVAALSGVRDNVRYEGQAAIELEALVSMKALYDAEPYPFDIASLEAGGVAWIGTRPMWRSLLADLERGESVGVIAARFHAGLADAIVAMAKRLVAGPARDSGGRVVLTGGVFQNAVLMSRVAGGLRDHGFEVLTHTRVPANDGGLSLGQAAIAAARDIAGRS
jgi:hydrogenase maturation protein HypF